MTAVQRQLFNPVSCTHPQALIFWPQAFTDHTRPPALRQRPPQTDTTHTANLEASLEVLPAFLPPLEDLVVFHPLHCLPHLQD